MLGMGGRERNRVNCETVAGGIKLRLLMLYHYDVTGFQQKPNIHPNILPVNLNNLNILTFFWSIMACPK